VTTIAVIGAGPYGLSIAAHLRQHQIPCRIFGVPMQMWRQHMPKGMVLKSDAFASNLSVPGNEFRLQDFCLERQRPYSDIGMRTPLQTIIDYALEVQRRYVGRVEESRVLSVSRNGRDFQLTLDTGEQCNAEKVVVASGLMPFRNLPDSLALLPNDMWSHVSAHHDLASFAGKRVIMIGGGQSALETAALLREAGAEVTVVTRRPLFWFDPAQEVVKPTAWQRVRRPNFGLGPGWRTWFLSEAPAAYRHLPAASGWPKHTQVSAQPARVG